MAEVTLENVRKVYPGGYEAVRDFTLEIGDGEFVVLVGPSGCGKSTTLRMVAGLEEITGGTISIGGRVVNEVHPKDRDIAMVFQNYALYPHMSVRKNMGFALKMRRTPRSEIDKRVQEAAAMLGIQELLERKPKQLSGGQRQRVAVGRAIVREPKAFLFDEPLSNLDAKLRVTTRGELKALHKRLRTTTIYVTHDQEEAMTLGDRIVVMADQRIQQADTPFDVYTTPVNRFVASFIGTPPMNFLDGAIERDGGIWFVEGSPGPDGQPQRLRVAPEHEDALSEYLGREVVLGLRPQHFSEAQFGNELQRSIDDGTAFRVTVSLIEPLGDQMDVHCATAKHPRIIARIAAHKHVDQGGVNTLRVEMENARYFEPGEFGRNIVLSTPAAATA